MPSIVACTDDGAAGGEKDGLGMGGRVERGPRKRRTVERLLSAPGRSGREDRRLALPLQLGQEARQDARHKQVCPIQIGNVPMSSLVNNLWRRSVDSHGSDLPVTLAVVGCGQRGKVGIFAI